jgi:hypothetical protein
MTFEQTAAGSQTGIQTAGAVASSGKWNGERRSHTQHHDAPKQTFQVATILRREEGGREGRWTEGGERQRAGSWRGAFVHHCYATTTDPLLTTTAMLLLQKHSGWVFSRKVL